MAETGDMGRAEETLAELEREMARVQPILLDYLNEPL
jgi:hypothetical protein